MTIKIQLTDQLWLMKRIREEKEVMILNQLLDGQHRKSDGGLFEKVSNSLLLTDIPTTKEIKTTLQ